MSKQNTSAGLPRDENATWRARHVNQIARGQPTDVFVLQRLHQ